MSVAVNGNMASTETIWRSLLRKFVDTRELTLIALILLIIAVMSYLSPHFFSIANFRAVSVGMTPIAIIVIGMAILLASGGFDLSVGSVMALSSTIVAMLLLAGLSIPAAFGVGLLVGAVAGLVNGLLVTALGINPLVATLGTMSIARGIALVLTEGFSISSLPAEFAWIGKASFIGIPALVILTLVLILIFDLAVRHTRFFRQVYFIGANEKAAMLSGINVNRVRIIAYVLTGMLAALAGVLLASRLMSGTPTAGNGLELQVLRCFNLLADDRHRHCTGMCSCTGHAHPSSKNLSSKSNYHKGENQMNPHNTSRRKLLGAGAGLAAGFGLPQLTPQALAAGAGKEYVFLSIVTQVPFWVDYRNALKDLEGILDIKATFTGPLDWDTAGQARQLDELIARRPAGIMIFPGDPATLAPGVQRAVDAGIPVTCCIGDIPDSPRSCFLEEKYPEIEVVDVVNDRADPSYAPTAYLQGIQANPDIVGIGGTDGDSGKGAAIAVHEAGRTKDIKIVAMDRNDDMLTYIEDGTIAGAVENTDGLKVVPDWKSAEINPLPNRVETGVMKITKENVEQFKHEKNG